MARFRNQLHLLPTLIAPVCNSEPRKKAVVSYPSTDEHYMDAVVQQTTTRTVPRKAPEPINVTIVEEESRAHASASGFPRNTGCPLYFG
jgi:hypothetical protein